MSGALLLPGMGADRRLFEPLASALPVSVPSWPKPEPRDTLQVFAARLAAALSDPPSVVGGASFGGMVALELAAIIRPRAVVLVGSCRTPAAVASHLRCLGAMARHLPAAAFRPRPWSSAFLLPKFGELNRDQRSLFWSMAAGVPASFLKWACSAVLSWRPSSVDVPVFHIHGGRDRLIPVKNVQPTEVVVDGGHLLSLTHPREVTTFVGRTLTAVG